MEIIAVILGHIEEFSYIKNHVIIKLDTQIPFVIDKKIFYKKNKFKGKIGIFDIDKNRINHLLNFYKVENNEFKKIF